MDEEAKMIRVTTSYYDADDNDDDYYYSSVLVFQTNLQLTKRHII